MKVGIPRTIIHRPGRIAVGHAGIEAPSWHQLVVRGIQQEVLGDRPGIAQVAPLDDRHVRLSEGKARPRAAVGPDHDPRTLKGSPLGAQSGELMGLQPQSCAPRQLG